MSEYEMVAGTEPDPNEKHEPRTYKSGLLMMTEIEDGVFVQWGNCARCMGRIPACKCAEGPQVPAHIQGWRDERFSNSLKVKREVFTDLDRDRLERLAQEAQDASTGDSNDDEIDLLRDALAAALGHLGMNLPEPIASGEDESDERALEADAAVAERDAAIRDEQALADADDAQRVLSEKVDDGVDKAISAVRDQKGDDIDVGF